MSRKTLKTALIALAVIALIVVGVAVAMRVERSHQVTPTGAGTSTVFQSSNMAEPIPTPETPDVVNFEGREYLLRDELSTLLIMGTDDDMDYGTVENAHYSQADLIVLAVLNEQEKTCSLLQIDRNSMTNVQVLDEHDQLIGTAYEQICIAHDYGSTPEIRCRNTAQTLTQMLYGAPVDNYISMTMDGIAALNDAAGGVTVLVEDDFTGVDDTLVKGEEVTLMGQHAVNFVRSRMSMSDDSSNAARMRRHRAYMTALVEQVRSRVKQDAGFALEMFTAVADYLTTDCAVDELSDYASALADYELTGIVNLEGDLEEREHEEFYPDEEKLMQLVIDTFYEPYEA